EPLARTIAEALHGLHASGAALERTHGLREELAILDARLGGLPRTLLARAREHRDAAAAALDRLRWRERPIHRDFYDAHIVIDEAGRLGLLDLDDAALSEPAVDVANFLAHLRLLALEQPCSSRAVEAVAVAFAARYSSLDRGLDRRLVAALET